METGPAICQIDGSVMAELTALQRWRPQTGTCEEEKAVWLLYLKIAGMALLLSVVPCPLILL